MLNFSSGSMNFGTGSGRSKTTEIVIIVALVALIIGITVITLMASGWISFKGEPPRQDTFHYYCTTCKKEIVLNKDQMKISEVKPPEGMPPMPPSVMPMGQMRPPCPECKKSTLVYMRNCPICKTYFVTEWDKNGSAFMGQPDPNMGKDMICPNCKGNITQYYKDNMDAAR